MESRESVCVLVASVVEAPVAGIQHSFREGPLNMIQSVTLTLLIFNVGIPGQLPIIASWD